jgi:putative dehydrogenase
MPPQRRPTALFALRNNHEAILVSLPVVAIFAQGAMGAGLARRLVAQGVRVLTCLDGRSAASRARAAEAGMQAVAFEALAEADLFLSIAPPAEAGAIARRLAPALSGLARPAVYADCNAVSPETVRQVGQIVAAAGAAFVDASIIGLPPSADQEPVIYASGPDARRLEVLNTCGLRIKRLDGPVGAASALKMSYAGITKGFAAIMSMMTLAAARSGAAEALRAELGDSQPGFLKTFGRQTDGMFPKAYRWVAEMQEIADYAGGDPEARAIYEAVSRFYARVAEDYEGEQAETGVLTRFGRG